MKLSMDKYRFYNSKNMVVAVATYAQLPVRGIAKCDPEDEFSFESGKMIAAARCNEKVAEKRFKRAQRKFKEAFDNFVVTQRYFEKMKKYLQDSEAAYEWSKNNVASVLKQFD